MDINEPGNMSFISFMSVYSIVHAFAFAVDAYQAIRFSGTTPRRH